MKNLITMVFAGYVAVTASSAFAAENMAKDGMMKKEEMTTDAMVNDGMMKKASMAKEGMMMKKEEQKK